MRIFRNTSTPLEVLKILLASLIAAFLLAGVAIAQPAVEAQPRNIDELKQQLLAYQKSGEYKRGLAAVAASARAYVETHAAGVTRPALVLDIDETSLSN